MFRFAQTSVTAALLLGGLLGLSGCAAGGGNGDVKGPVTVYVSLPLSGPRAPDGTDAADGARLAFSQAANSPTGFDGPTVRIRVLDGAAGGDPQVAAAADARTAVQDSSTGAYIGELDSAPTRNSLPILNNAGIAQVSPGAGAVDLTNADPDYPGAPGLYQPSGRATFARLIPNDEQLATVAADQPTRIHVAAHLNPAELPRATSHVFKELFAEHFAREPGPYAVYGYEAMRLTLASISAAQGGANGFRTRVVDELLSAARTNTPLGDYAIGNQGDTSLCLVQPYRGTTPLKPVCAPAAAGS